MTNIYTDNAERISQLIPEPLRMCSGSVFYTGTRAFDQPSRIYILGLNPGGDPIAQSDETIALDLAEWLGNDRMWSAYADESWEGAAPGTWGMQPRMLHMFDRLGLNPRDVPASNVVFVRSRDEQAIAAEKAELLKLCWPVHQAVIDTLSVDTIVCLGNTAGSWVRQQIGAHELFDIYRESNSRGWTSQAHQNAAGLAVVTVSHPGRQNWKSPDSDPTELIERVLSSSGVRKLNASSKTGHFEAEPQSAIEGDVRALDGLEVAAVKVSDDWRDGHLTHLQNGDGKAAYKAMRAVEDLGLKASPNTGAVKAVRLHDKSGNYLFSYIVNRAGLLFYVRKPATTAFPDIGRSLKAAFADATLNPAGEWTLAVPTAAVAHRVIGWLKATYFP